MKTPEWKGYFPELKAGFILGGNIANEEQANYYEYWKSQLLNGNYLEIGDNIAYAFVFLYQSIADFVRNQNIERMQLQFDSIYNAYGNNSKIEQYYYKWLSDAYLLVGDFNKSWEYKYDILFKRNKIVNIGIGDIINIKHKSNNKPINAHQLLCAIGMEYKLKRRFDESVISSFVSILQEELDFTLQETGYDIIENTINEIDVWNLKADDFQKYKHLYSTTRLLHEIGNYFGEIEYRKDLERMKVYAFGGFPSLSYLDTLFHENRCFKNYTRIPEVISGLISRLHSFWVIELFQRNFPELRKKLKYDKLR